MGGVKCYVLFGKVGLAYPRLNQSGVSQVIVRMCNCRNLVACCLSFVGVVELVDATRLNLLLVTVVYTSFSGK